MTQTEFIPNAESPEAPPADQKSVYVIFNPVSGKSDPEQRKQIISDALADHHYTCQFIATTREQGARACAEEALAQGADLLAVSGGDGTVMEAMSAVVGKNIPIAVLPAGTGNLLSVNLGIPMTVPEAVHVALSGHKYALDLARTADGRYFAIMGGLGMDAQMIKDSDREAKDKMGKLAYFWAAFKNLPRHRALVEIRLDDRPPIRRRAKSVLLAKSPAVWKSCRQPRRTTACWMWAS
jgi:diacylglycerol kinase family enzyme